MSKLFAQYGTRQKHRPSLHGRAFWVCTRCGSSPQYLLDTGGNFLGGRFRVLPKP